MKIIFLFQLISGDVDALCWTQLSICLARLTDNNNAAWSWQYVFRNYLNSQTNQGGRKIGIPGSGGVKPDKH